MYAGPPREMMQGGTIYFIPSSDKHYQLMQQGVTCKVGPSEIHRPLLGSLGPGPMYRLNPPLIGPECMSSM